MNGQDTVNCIGQIQMVDLKKRLSIILFVGEEISYVAEKCKEMIEELINNKSREEVSKVFENSGIEIEQL